jgi:NADPH-dependent 2,4-dienoyl-CoA reductase/sulfur reductase-like enzyme
MKIVIIGANHAGIAAANTLLDNFPGNEVVLIEKNSNLSYLGCGSALWIGRQIPTYEDLFYTRPEAFEKKGAKILMETLVTNVDFERRTVSCRHQGDEWLECYDKLILATGSSPIGLNVPNRPGKDLEGIYFLKLFQEAQYVDAEVAKPSVETVAVIGAGFIGVEIAEALERRGKKVLLFDAAPNALSGYYDTWLSDDMDVILTEHGIDCHYNEIVTAFEGQTRIETLWTNKGKYQVDLVINCVGFRPNSELGRGHLKLFKNGAYLVDNHQQTSDPNVYAIGDCATIYSNAIDDTTYIALATNAVRSGIVAGYNVGGLALDAIGVQGSSAISIYGLNMTSTGLSFEAAKRAGINAAYTDFEDLQRPGFMPENAMVKIRIVYDKDSRRIVGAQLSSKENIALLINMFSLAIEEHVTIDKLKLLDIFFMPHFNQPYNYVTMAALGAE